MGHLERRCPRKIDSTLAETPVNAVFMGQLNCALAGQLMGTMDANLNATGVTQLAAAKTSTLAVLPHYTGVFGTLVCSGSLFFLWLYRGIFRLIRGITRR